MFINKLIWLVILIQSILTVKLDRNIFSMIILLENIAGLDFLKLLKMNNKLLLHLLIAGIDLGNFQTA